MPTKNKKPSISISGKTYDRLNTSMGLQYSVHSFVDGILASALDDPTILKRVLKECRTRKAR